MYRGINNLTMDEKGRVALPSRYREDLDTVFVTIDPLENCLLAYGVSDWEEIEQKIISLPTFNAQARRISRLLIGHACEINIDNSGRMLLPQSLREYADLAKQVVIVGQGKKFEIWNASLWDSKRREWIAGTSDLQELPVELQTLSL